MCLKMNASTVTWQPAQSMRSCLLLQWRPGDFIISDNLAVAHEASPETQLSEMDMGLRVMHRVTIAGQHVPTKQQHAAS